MYDVFVSYRHADGEPARAIVAALRARGLEVWFDETAIADFAPITAGIVDGLSRSRLLLALYSASYPQSRPCQWELTAAYLAAQTAGDPTRRVLVVNPEPDGAHIHPVDLRDAKYAVPGNPEAIAAAVAARVAGLDKQSLGEIRPLADTRWLPIKGQRAWGTQRFVGRLPELWRLHSALTGSTAAIITVTSGAGGRDLAQVQGMGGIGKSLLAEEYARRFAAAYPGGIVWLRGSRGDGAPLPAAELEAMRADQMRTTAFGLGLPASALPEPAAVEAAVVRALDAGGPHLWIVDDVPHGIDIDTLRGWLAPTRHGRTLVTTRNRALGALGTPVPLDVLTPEDALRLLTLHRPPANPEEDSAARAIVEALGCHALAVDVAGAAVQSYGYAHFQTRLSSPDRDVLELAAQLADELPTGHDKSIAATLLGSVQHLDEGGHDFLRLAAELATAPIPRALVAKTLATADSLPADEAEDRAALAIRQALTLSLAEDGLADTVTVHALVARTLRFRDPDADRRAALRTAAVAVLDVVMPGVTDIRNHAALENWITHARHLTTPATDAATLDLLGWIGRFEHERAAYAAAERAFCRQAEGRRQVLGEEHPATLTSLSNLALALGAQGDRVRARALEERALASRRRVLGEEHPDTLTSLNNLALTLGEQGDWARARALHEQALASRRRVQGEEHPDTLTSLNNLALTLGAQGDRAGARTLHEQVLAIRRRVQGEEHPDTLTSLNNLALTLGAQGDRAGARTLQEHVLAISRRVLGEEHPDTLTSLNNLAYTLSVQGDWARARALHEQALAIRQRVQGEEHPDTLTSLSNLAYTLGEQGDWAGARALLERALAIRRQVLGEEHPDTLTSLSNLAYTLGEQGDWAGARALLEQALAIRRRALGEEHPDTLTSLNNLALMLWEQGDRTGACDLFQQVLAGCTKILGAQHPNTRRVAQNLAIARDQSGQAGPGVWRRFVRWFGALFRGAARPGGEGER